MKHLGLAGPEQRQRLHQHVHVTPDQLRRMADDQLDRAEAAVTQIVDLIREIDSRFETSGIAPLTTTEGV